MTSIADAEVAVRNYLVFLEDPTQLIDQDEIARLEAARAATSDPLERLQTINRLRQLQAGEPDSFREAFCAHAKAWAEANGIQPASFLEVGVDEATLRAAGLGIRAVRSQPAGRRNGGAGRGRGQVRAEDVKAAARQRTGSFTLADLAAVCGASPMTIRKAVEELIAAGEVERLGPTPEWSQPGRAPIQYRRVAKRSKR